MFLILTQVHNPQSNEQWAPYLMNDGMFASYTLHNSTQQSHWTRWPLECCFTLSWTTKINTCTMSITIIFEYISAKCTYCIKIHAEQGQNAFIEENMCILCFSNEHRTKGKRHHMMVCSIAEEWICALLLCKSVHSKMKFLLGLIASLSHFDKCTLRWKL